MSVRCSKCGEELMGAVNRCWKCGHTFVLRLESDGRPPVRATIAPSPSELRPGEPSASEPLAARVLEPGDPVPAPSSAPIALSVAVATRPPTSDIIDAQRARLMAMGGTVGSLVLGVFAATFGMLWPPAALVAILGLALGIWGLGSPRRNLALVGMLICCLAIGIGAVGGARVIVARVKASRPLEAQP